MDGALRVLSKETWTGNGTLENINCGSLQRIADATEKMASSYDAIRSERDRYEAWYTDERKRREKAYRRIAALQGVITKLKNKSAASPEPKEL